VQSVIGVDAFTGASSIFLVRSRVHML